MKKPKLVKFFEKVPREHWALAALFILAAGGISYSLWVEHTRAELLSAQIDVLKNELAVTSRILEESIAETHSSLASELAAERAKASALSQQLGNVAGTVGSLSGSVNTLEKLSETDPELLQKYSKVYFLNENYIPERLAAIDKKYLYTESRPESLEYRAWAHLKDLLNAAGAQGVTLYVKSAYRSFDEQTDLKAAYSVTYGSGANAFSADQGYSEHQLGTTVDLITTGLGGNLSEAFGETQAFSWLKNNAHKYGFILSYPKSNTYYVYEPWHWRFVGTALAGFLHNTGKNFYDLEQRELDTYLANIFD